MHVVDTSQGETAPQRASERRPLEHRRGHAQPDEREPENACKREPGEQERRRDEHERPGAERDDPGPQRRLATADELRRVGKREREERRGEDERRRRRLPPEAQRRLVRDRDDEPERQRPREVGPVEADRLGDELADRAPLRRERRRRALVRRPRPRRHRANATERASRAWTGGRHRGPRGRGECASARGPPPPGRWR